MLIIIRLSKCCPRVVTFGDSTPVRAICLLIISSFATLTEISFSNISPVTLEGINETRVNIQPSVKFLDPAKHLVSFVISICFILFAILPFALLLFLAPFLVRCINMNRIKPFLDEFQGCYKDKFRWMAGFYFLCRIVYLLLFTYAGAGLKTTQYGVQFLSLIILLVHVILQPYKSRFLNILDSVILSDLMILALLFGPTANVVLKSALLIRKVSSYILILLPVAYVLFLSLLALATNLSRKYAIDKNVFFRTFRMPNTGKTETPSISQEDGHEQYREPLLGMMEYSESLGGHPRSLSILRRAQRNSFAELPLVICSPANVQLAIGRTVLERPVNSVVESAIFDNAVGSPK